MSKLSVVISAYNEQEKLPECLASVSFADEVIVVDCSSTDDTAMIAKNAGATVLKRPNDLMLNRNKNYGFSHASHTWILSLDADERVSKDLASEIQTQISGTNEDYTSAYKIPRQNIIFGKSLRHTGWYPDFQIRLFQKDKGKFACKHVHEQLSVDGSIGELRHSLIHQSYTSIAEFLNKFFSIYAPNEAENLIKQENYSFSPSDFIVRPFHEFLNRFYFHKGYKDGLHGLVLSLLMAFYHFVVVCYVWEKQKFSENVSDTREIFETELKKAKRDLSYWRNTSTAEETNNPLVSSLHRLKRKLL